MNHAKTLVDMEHSGVVSMLVNDKVDDLKRMYDLFSRVPSTLDCLRDCMCDYVKKSGGQLVSEQEQRKEPVCVRVCVCVCVCMSVSVSMWLCGYVSV